MKNKIKLLIGITFVFTGLVFTTGDLAFAQSANNPCGTSGVCRNQEFARASGKSLKADVYLPTNNPTTKSPAIVYFFPGSWAAGNKNVCADRGMTSMVNNFRAEGYAFICVDYRLTNVASFPAQIHDAKSAVRWVRANAEKYNIDTNKIGALGWSAGGHLALMLGATAGEAYFEGTAGNTGQSSAVQAVISLVGPSYFMPPMRSWTDGSQSSAVYKYLGGNPDRDQKAYFNAVRATVSNNINGDEPPMLLQYGNRDTLVPTIHGSSLDTALKTKNRISVFKVYNGGHGDFDYYPDQISFFNQYLRGSVVSTPPPPTVPAINDTPAPIVGNVSAPKPPVLPQVSTPNKPTLPQVTSGASSNTIVAISQLLNLSRADSTYTDGRCVFNARKYADYYSDLKRVFGYNEENLRQHWIIHGIREGRTPCGADMPSCKFDGPKYVALHSDLVQANVPNGLFHYLTFGIRENRAVCRP
jgi:acetyl esterase/lipase